MYPERISRYEIKSELGRGGMATVFTAHDPRFKRDVALKVLPTQFLHDPTFRARFEREAQTIAAIEHPAIVPVYDFGEDNGQPYLVMRLMTGGSLADRLKEGPLPVAETAQILARLAPALDEIHSRGIIHRDLKPGNILFDQYNNAFLSDFGIARLTQATHTLTGEVIIGTPSYMSPEQARGESDIDGRSDIYALGAILFEMLTGHLPYEATTPMGLVMKHITDPVPQLSLVRPDLPAVLDTMISRAMAKERSHRYPSAAEMAADTARLTQAASQDTFPGMKEKPVGSEPSLIPAAPSQPVDPGASGGHTPGRPVEKPIPAPADGDPRAGAQAHPSPPPAVAPRSPSTPPRKGLPTWFWLGAGLLAAIGLCGLVTLGSYLAFFSDKKGGQVVIASPTTDEINVIVTEEFIESVPTDAPETGFPYAYFSDDFSNPESGWDRGEEAGSQTDYYHGYYRIYVDKPNMLYYARPHKEFENVNIEVDMTKAGGADENHFGLICRFVDENNFYLFAMTSSGYYGIGKYVNGNFSLVGMETMKYSDSIHQGKTTNRLRAECKDSFLSIYVNNIRLITVEDSSFTTGDIGLSAAAFQLYGTDILFDNFQVREP